MGKITSHGSLAGTIGRSALFCISCAIILATASGLIKSTVPRLQILPLSLLFATAMAYLLTLLFTRWEGLSLEAVGVMPGHLSAKRFFTGLSAGLIMALLQPAIVACSGHMVLVRSSGVAISTLPAHLLLYSMVACREELAFRGYPLRALDYAAGPWIAQGIVACIFIMEHKVGGMTWMEAIIGSGTGAVLFGMAALKSKGLALPFGLHTAWNTGQWALGFKDNTGLFQVVIEKGFEQKVRLWGWGAYLVIMWTAILIVYLRNKQGKK